MNVSVWEKSDGRAGLRDVVYLNVPSSRHVDMSPTFYRCVFNASNELLSY